MDSPIGDDSLTCPQMDFNGLMGYRTGHRRRCWGQVRLEYSGQITSLTFCNMSTAAWEVRVALGRLVVSINALRYPWTTQHLTCPQRIDRAGHYLWTA